MDYIKRKKTNLLYNIFSYKSQLPKITSNSEIIILGKIFKKTKKKKIKEINLEIEKFIDQIPWFSYRKNFDEIFIDEKKTGISTDSSWGCMIRVGQNCLFMILKKYFCDEFKKNDIDLILLKRYFKEKKKISFDEKIKKVGILKNDEDDEEFYDDISKNNKNYKIQISNSLLTTEKKINKKNNNILTPTKKLQIVKKYDLFSLQNFVIHASKDLNKKPGNWFRPTTFLFTLESLTPSFKNLKTLTIIENVIILQKLLKTVFSLKTQESFEFKKIITKSGALNYLKTKKWENKLILSISTLLGFSKVDRKYKYFLDRFLNVSSNFGVLGGFESSAYFIIGTDCKDNYFYLDPHYVKESLNFEYLKDSEILDDFFKKSVFKIKYDKLSNSVSFVFFLEGKEDFEEFWDAVEDLEKFFGDDFFLSVVLEDFVDDLSEEIITF